MSLENERLVVERYVSATRTDRVPEGAEITLLLLQ